MNHFLNSIFCSTSWCNKNSEVTLCSITHWISQAFARNLWLVTRNQALPVSYSTCIVLLSKLISYLCINTLRIFIQFIVNQRNQLGTKKFHIKKQLVVFLKVGWKQRVIIATTIRFNLHKSKFCMYFLVSITNVIYYYT